MISVLKQHWINYVMEAICLAIFMVSASFFATLLEFPGSEIRKALPDSVVRLWLMGIAMGLTAVAIIYSPMGRRSGAHMNPAITVAFMTLGKISPLDAAFYVLFQLLGGLLAVVAMAGLLGEPFRDSPINYVITVPGQWGVTVAFVAEFLMAFIMMGVVLIVTNSQQLSSYMGWIAGCLVCLYVVLTANVSGFSMNPARTLSSAIPSGTYTSIWVYLTAPLLGMLLASGLYRRFDGLTYCAKLDHAPGYPCIFKCDHAQLNGYMTEQENRTNP